MLTVALVVLVIFLFLRSVYATIIPSVAVPLSLVGTFAAMYALGYSLDNLSLMALTISTGFVVDDAIVMVENISRYIEEGDPPMQAALKGAEQIGFTILSLTVSLIAVLIPLLFMGDVVGRLFREFAVTLAVTIVDFGRRVADADADDGVAHPAAQSGVPAGAILQGVGARLRTHDRFLRAHAEGRAALPDDHAAGRPRDAAAHGVPLHRHPQGIFPGAGYGRHSGHLAGAADDRLPGHGGKAAGAGEGDSAGPRGREPVFVHRRGRHEHHDQQRPDVDQPEAAEPAEYQRRRRDPPAAVQAEPGAGHPAVHAAGAEHHGG